MQTVVIVVVCMGGEEVADEMENLFTLVRRRVSFCFCHVFRAK